MRRTAIALYGAAFGREPRIAASAPGRVTLMGDDASAHGGPGLSVAIGERAVAVVGPGEPDRLEVVSAQFPENGAPVPIAWRQVAPLQWPGPIVSVLHELAALEAAPRNGGARVAIASAVPMGAGLASSAALMVAAARALAALAGADLTPRQIASVAFRAAAGRAGGRRGIMNPIVATLAKPGHALLFESASLLTRHVPLHARLLLVETGGRHDVAGRAAALRLRECESAVRRLRVELPELVWLASWPVAWLARLKRALPQPQRARAVHVVSEVARVRYGAELLERRRLGRFGELLYESHESCRRYYECSAPELDLIVAAAKRAGALGARLTGAGWGGSVVVLVGSERERGVAGREQRIVERVTQAFRKAYDREPVIRALRPGGGVRAERL